MVYRFVQVSPRSKATMRSKKAMLEILRKGQTQQSGREIGKSNCIVKDEAARKTETLVSEEG